MEQVTERAAIAQTTRRTGAKVGLGSRSQRNAEHAWRRWATEHRAVSAMLGGLVGVHVASVLGFWFGGWFGPVELFRLDYNTGNGAVELPNATPTVQFLVGGLSHYLDGVFFAVIFGIAVAPMLPIRSTFLGNVAKAVIFGTVLGLLALFVTAPYIFGPLRGVRDPWIAIHEGPDYVISVLLFHWIYGLHLGLIYNPIDDNADE
jgi:hypothetical protein